MTHDELLELTKSPTYMNSRTLEHPYIAIRAVLELHKPIDNEIEGIYQSTSFEQDICAQCATVFYPCPTIKTIAAELS